MMIGRWTILLLSLWFLSCGVRESFISSTEYQNEEINVYNKLLDELMDSVGVEVADTVRFIFYLGDTLGGEGHWQGKDEFIKGDLKTRSFSISDLTDKSLHKFIRASDTLRLDPGDHFSGHWIKLSRVRFDKDLTMGFLRVGVWCGNLCSWTQSFDIEKKDGQWKVVKMLKGPPA